MPKRKEEYYTLKNYIEGIDIDPKDVTGILKEVYSAWKEDESQDIIQIFQNRYLATAKNTEGSSEINARGDEDSENQAEQSPEKQEEETYGQSLEEPKEPKEPKVRRVKSEDLEKMEEDKVKTAASVPTKFDWEKYLEENPQFKTKDKDSGVEVLLLQFFKDIAHKEGFLSVRYSPLGNADQGYCGVSCEIEWPNLPRVSSGLADAHFNNCHSFTKYYLAPMCENRSFIRAVKQYFNIPYLGKDEIGQTPKEEQKSEEAPTGPYVTLKKAAKDKLNITSFDGFKSLLRKQAKENPETAWLQPEEYQDWVDYNDWDEIKKPKILELIGKIKA